MPAVKPSRESLIALRGRHEAYRIAADIAYPHVDVPPPPLPAIPLENPIDYRPLSFVQRWELASIFFWILASGAVGMGLTAFAWAMYVCMKYGSQVGM